MNKFIVVFLLFNFIQWWFEFKGEISHTVWDVKFRNQTLTVSLQLSFIQNLIEWFTDWVLEFFPLGFICGASRCLLAMKTLLIIVN